MVDHLHSDLWKLIAVYKGLQYTPNYSTAIPFFQSLIEAWPCNISHSDEHLIIPVKYHFFKVL
jgi:hypothetical protein